MNQVLAFYHSIPASTWQVLGAALGLSGLLQALKHYFFSKLSAHALMTLTTLFAFLASAAQWALQTVHTNPTVLGQHTAVLVGAMTLAYRYVVAPGYTLLLDAKNYRTTTTSAPASTAGVATEPAAVSEAAF